MNANRVNGSEKLFSHSHLSMGCLAPSSTQVWLTPSQNSLLDFSPRCYIILHVYFTNHRLLGNKAILWETEISSRKMIKGILFFAVSGSPTSMSRFGFHMLLKVAFLFPPNLIRMWQTIKATYIKNFPAVIAHVQTQEKAVILI